MKPSKDTKRRLKSNMSGLIKIYLLTVILLLISFFNGDCPKHFSGPHIGVWEDKDFKGTKAIISFKADGIGSIFFNDRLCYFKYIIDYSKRPVWLDLLYSREGNPYRAKVIVKFLDTNRIKWRTFFAENRPEEFIQGDDIYTVILNRLYPII